MVGRFGIGGAAVSTVCGCAVIMFLNTFAMRRRLEQPPRVLIQFLRPMIAAALMAYSIRKSTKRIFEKQTHEKDKGWTGVKDPVVKEENTISVKNLKKIGRFSEKFMTIGLSILVIAVSYFVQFENIKSFSKIAAIAVVFFLFLNCKGMSMTMPTFLTVGQHR